MKKSVILATMIAAGLAASANADVLACWDFQSTANPHPLVLNNSTTIIGMAASVGTGTSNGRHALATTDWSAPAGNGSSNSWSSNDWSANDYYEFSFSTTGFDMINMTWDQARSSTGPSAFKIAASVDGGGSFFDVFSYVVLQNGGAPNPAWNGTTGSAAYSFATPIAGGENAANLLVRIMATAGAAAGGTNRIDNVCFNGSVIVPAPASVAVLGLAGLLAGRRRR